jgi:hypothetical protein
MAGSRPSGGEVCDDTLGVTADDAIAPNAWSAASRSGARVLALRLQPGRRFPQASAATDGASSTKRAAAHRAIVGGRRGFGVRQEGIMSHQPPKESKKKPHHTPKEKKAIKQQKKHTGDVVPFIKT